MFCNIYRKPRRKHICLFSFGMKGRNKSDTSGTISAHSFLHLNPHIVHSHRRQGQTPSIAVKSRRVCGLNHQVPIEIGSKEQIQT